METDMAALPRALVQCPLIICTSSHIVLANVTAVTGGGMDGVPQLIGSKSKPQHGRPITKRESCQLGPTLKVTGAAADRRNVFSCRQSLWPQLTPSTDFSPLPFLRHLNLNRLLSSTFTSHGLFLTPHLPLLNPLLCLPFSLHPPSVSPSTSLSQSSALSPAVSSSSTEKLVVTLSLSLIQFSSLPALLSALSLSFPFPPNLLYISGTGFN